MGNNIAEAINNMGAGNFIGCIQRVLYNSIMQLMKACMAYVAETYCSQMLIDSAASLLFACIEQHGNKPL